MIDFNNNKYIILYDNTRSNKQTHDTIRQLLYVMRDN